MLPAWGHFTGMVLNVFFFVSAPSMDESAIYLSHIRSSGSCGAWIVPSFYFVKSKVDRLPICPRPVGNGGAERSTSLRGGGLPPSVAEERIADISLSRETQGIQ